MSETITIKVPLNDNCAELGELGVDVSQYLRGVLVEHIQDGGDMEMLIRNLRMGKSTAQTMLAEILRFGFVMHEEILDE